MPVQRCLVNVPGLMYVVLDQCVDMALWLHRLIVLMHHSGRWLWPGHIQDCLGQLQLQHWLTALAMKLRRF